MDVMYGSKGLTCKHFQLHLMINLENPYFIIIIISTQNTEQTVWLFLHLTFKPLCRISLCLSLQVLDVLWSLQRNDTNIKLYNKPVGIYNMSVLLENTLITNF